MGRVLACGPFGLLKMALAGDRSRLTLDRAERPSVDGWASNRRRPSSY